AGSRAETQNPGESCRYLPLFSMAPAAEASAFAALASVAARPARTFSAAASSDAFFAASVVSGMAPLPLWAQGFISLASKPWPPGPTRQFSVGCGCVRTPFRSDAPAARSAWVAAVAGWERAEGWE